MGNCGSCDCDGNGSESKPVEFTIKVTETKFFSLLFRIAGLIVTIKIKVVLVKIRIISKLCRLKHLELATRWRNQHS